MKQHAKIALALAATMTLGACATTSNGYGYGSGAPGPVSGQCYDCGTVTRIDTASQSTAPNATGAIIGGVVGAVAAHEIAKNQTDSKGRQNTATVAGAVGGAIAGNAIQNRTQNSYNVTVRMDDGRYVTTSQSDISGIREGSYVRVYNGRAWAR
ncbi:glycine zipper 2TM domain-containing protein [Lysobacter soyae]|uniref:Glycine zipper 2TM domain-containing protein n=1 Tax=Lysobacter soyae TaxID=2764185 RepID=A0ABX8WL39_9GAMM|nr:glycine zipper 2TM domain-containing protein [Lysobacter sp. CJ11]QYR52335.1 glycine zipper 2TM domain-containing protein [Lysobacter sp. CJ11]